MRDDDDLYVVVVTRRRSARRPGVRPRAEQVGRQLGERGDDPHALDRVDVDQRRHGDDEGAARPAPRACRCASPRAPRSPAGVRRSARRPAGTGQGTAWCARPRRRPPWSRTPRGRPRAARRRRPRRRGRATTPTRARTAPRRPRARAADPCAPGRQCTGSERSSDSIVAEEVPHDVVVVVLAAGVLDHVRHRELERPSDERGLVLGAPVGSELGHDVRLGGVPELLGLDEEPVHVEEHRSGKPHVALKYNARPEPVTCGGTGCTPTDLPFRVVTCRACLS